MCVSRGKGVQSRVPRQLKIKMRFQKSFDLFLKSVEAEITRLLLPLYCPTDLLACLHLSWITYLPSNSQETSLLPLATPLKKGK